MSSLRPAAVVGLAALLFTSLSACRSPGEGGTEPGPAKSSAVDVTLKGVDTSALTAREKSEWSRLVSELLAPCPDQPVSLSQCVNESRSCRACLPAARMLSELVRRGLARQQIETAFKARFSPESIKNIDVSNSPRKGAANASVLIAEFADFECPACGMVRPLLDQMVKKFPNDLGLVFKHYPLAQHPNAEKAARAAVAAHRQGKFWEMHAELFENQEKLDATTIEQIAKGIGLDMKRFVQDRDSEETADLVARDRKQGQALELSSTPSVFINGRLFTASGEFGDDLERWLMLELELVGRSPTPVAAEASARPLASAAAPAPTAAVSAPSAAAVGAAKAPKPAAPPPASSR